MQRVVIDTNVLISALIQQSYPHLVISNIFTDTNIEWCISDDILQEYYDVLKRDKFSKYPSFIIKAETLLASVETIAKKYIPKIKLNIIDDLDDNKFLELALESNAHFLITGNTANFTMASYKETKIVSPRAYWEEHR